MFVLGKLDGLLDFDAVFASLSRHCPGTELLDDDYYATRIARSIELFHRLGKPTDNHVVACTIEASRKLGRTRQIRVTLSGAALVGTVSQTGVLLATKQVVVSSAITPVLTALAEIAGLKIEVDGVA
jgi:hypothetical protein